MAPPALSFHSKLRHAIDAGDYRYRLPQILTSTEPIPVFCCSRWLRSFFTPKRPYGWTRAESCRSTEPAEARPNYQTLFPTTHLLAKIFTFLYKHYVVLHFLLSFQPEKMNKIHQPTKALKDEVNTPTHNMLERLPKEVFTLILKQVESSVLNIMVQEYS